MRRCASDPRTSRRAAGSGQNRSLIATPNQPRHGTSRSTPAGIRARASRTSDSARTPRALSQMRVAASSARRNGYTFTHFRGGDPSMHRPWQRRVALFFCCATAAVVASPSAFAEPIAKAPAFTIAELVQLSAQNWITNGGNVYNQRYSLARLRSTAATSAQRQSRVAREPERLRVWARAIRSRPRRCSTKAFSMSSPGADDVFAVDVETGKILWTYKANVDFKHAVICCGRLSRGVGLGDGKVYVGRLDGRLVALDQAPAKSYGTSRPGDPKDQRRHHGRAAVLRRQGHRRLHGR